MTSPDNSDSSPGEAEELIPEFFSSPCYLHESASHDFDGTSFKSQISVKRIYDPLSHLDERRFLVDRLWPRGVSKTEAALEAWLKEIAPSSGLRRRFHQQPDDWPDFSRRYLLELHQLREQEHEQLKQLEQAVLAGPVTLLYASQNRVQNHALLLRDFLVQCD